MNKTSVEKKEFEGKGRAFKGLFGGDNYVRFGKLFGIKERFYRNGLGDIRLRTGMRAVDLGCGPGALSCVLAETAPANCEIFGFDISEDQLKCARRNEGLFACNLQFLKGSMDELPFKDGSVDLVMTSMALHETPPEVRRGAIAQTARILKKGGRFLLVDWSHPRFGLQGILWFPLCCWGERNKDNWNNVYPELCRKQGLEMKEDRYLNSIARRQVFEKPSE